MAIFDSADLSDPLSSAWADLSDPFIEAEEAADLKGQKPAPEKSKMAKVTKWPDDLSKMELEEEDAFVKEALPGEPLASPPEAVPVEEKAAVIYPDDSFTHVEKAAPEPKPEPVNREVLDRWSFKRTKLFTLLHQVDLFLHPGRYRFTDNNEPVTQEHLDKAKEAQQ